MRNDYATLLNVLEFKKQAPHQSSPAVSRLDPQAAHIFHLDTCQRTLWVAVGEPIEHPDTPGPYHHYAGTHAYHYLLRLATGLESLIRGETEILGQLRAAWKHFANVAPPRAVQDLRPWMDRLLNDAKEVRTLHLQSAGGSSYGALVRKVLRQLTPPAPGPIWLVGAGKLARVVLPYLLDEDATEAPRALWITNRSATKLAELDAWGQQQFGPKWKNVRFGRSPERPAQVVVCQPYNLDLDVALRQELAPDFPLVIHLGGPSAQNTTWADYPSFFSLQDLYALEERLRSVRSLQWARAERACKERAQLRGLGPSLSLPHGWEDLGGFVELNARLD